MNPKKADMITLETMPNDMIMVIVSKVGATSSLDYFNTITSCKSLNFGFNNHFVAKDLNLAHLIKRPLLAYEYPDLMESCLKSNNVDANYIRACWSSSIVRMKAWVSTTYAYLLKVVTKKQHSSTVLSSWP